MTTKEFKFANGDEVEDIVTGFQGIITATCHYLTGRIDYLVEAKCKDVSIDAKTVWVDEGGLRLTCSGVIKINVNKS